MAEKVFINVVSAPIVPSRHGPCDPDSIQVLRPLFEQGQSGVENLNPAALIQDPETGRLLVYDGNTRLTLGTLYNLLVPAVIYRVGEILTDRDGTMPIDQTALETVKRLEAISREHGYTSYSVLASEIE